MYWVSAARHIELFETESGRCFVSEYIEDLQPRSTAKIVKVMETVAVTEHPPVHFFKKLQGRGELWEIRVKEHRFIGFYVSMTGIVPRKFILVSAFKKQSDKTPLQEIEVALKRRDTYLSRQTLFSYESL